MIQIQLDQSTLPANDQQVRFRQVGSSEWQEGYYIGEDGAFAEMEGRTTSAFDVEEWEPLETELTGGEQLRRHRESLGLTQAAYAELVGFSRNQTISDYEQGKKVLPGFMKRIMQLEKEVQALKNGRR